METGLSVGRELHYRRCHHGAGDLHRGHPGETVGDGHVRPTRRVFDGTLARGRSGPVGWAFTFAAAYNLVRLPTLAGLSGAIPVTAPLCVQAK